MTLYTSSGTTTYDDDTYLSSAAPTSNYGGSGTIYCGTAATPGECRSLLRFDLTNGTNPISPGATVSAGTVTLYAEQASGGRTVQLFKCLRLWVENQATWNVYSTGNSWASAGCKSDSDRDATGLGSAVVSATGAIAIPLTADGINVVNAWVADSSSNNGFLLAQTSVAGDLQKFTSLEGGTVANRPYLTLTYTGGTSGAAGYTLILNTT